jgi:hypothetical protein
MTVPGGKGSEGLTRPSAVAGRAAEHPDLAASPLASERHGRGVQERLGVRRMGRTQRDSERSGDSKKPQRLAPDGRADLRAPAPCARQRRPGKHHRELLAPVAAGDVAAADVTFQKGAYFHEHPVARLVAGPVVDLLETVQIHHDQRKGHALRFARISSRSR